MQVHTTSGNVNVKGIDGAFDVTSDKGTIRLQINKLKQGTGSAAYAAKGNIVASVDPEVRDVTFL